MKKKESKNPIKIMDSMIGELSELGDRGRKIHRAQKKITAKLQKIIDVCDEEINKNLADDEEAAKLLQQAKEVVSKLQTLWRRRR